MLPFEYTPLEHLDSTRLICLYPGSEDEPIRCSLYETVPHLSNHRYCALSYAWGDPAPVHAICCNGRRAHITQNLFSALNRLRHESQDIILWVDALCINQSSEPEALRERARQVEMMHKIFGSADRVIVDFGEADEETPELLSNLALFDQLPLEYWAEPLASWPDTLLENVSIPAMKGSFWPSFARFIQRPWFKRVWMFQEFVLGREVTFLLGAEFYSEAFLSHSVFSASELFMHLLDLGREFSTGTMTVQEMVTQIQTGYLAAKFKVFIRQCHRSSSLELLNLATLLHVTQWLKATNVQDRVYALLSLTASTTPTSFPVVYTETSDETALRLSLFMLEQSPLYLLYRCVGVESTKASWMLTLEYKQIDALQTAWEPGAQNPWFRACGETPLSITLNQDGLSLSINAVVVGRVAHLADIWQPPDFASFSELHGSDVLAPFRGISAWIDERVSASSSRYSHEDFWRTMVADLVHKVVKMYRSCDFADFVQSLTAFTRIIFDGADDSKTPEHRKEMQELDKQASLYVGSLPLCVGRRLSVLESQVPCLVPGNTCIGDVLCILTGAPLPLVLRPQVDYFRIVGCCYIHDLMDGQFFRNENLSGITEIIIR